MTADDLSAPLGQQPVKRRRKLPISASQLIAATLLLFLGVFAAWAIVGDNPFGGEPVVAVPIDLHALTAAKKTEAVPAPEATPSLQGSDRHNVAANASAPGSPAPAQNNAPRTKTVTIIDGKTGARQEVVIPDGGNAGNSTSVPSPSPNLNLIEMTPRGPIPKIAAGGTRPSEAFARPVKPLANVPDAPRIALIVGGLGVSASGTAEAITKMPEAVTLAFMPYGSDVERLVARARAEGHEILLQVPLEPFNYPENDSGPQTLLTTLTPEQNLERLHWLMSRFQGYVGIVGAMGARFTASEQSFAPIMRETAKRGLIFVDDGANARSVAGRVAGGNSLAFAKADIVLDAVPTPGEIDHALGRLEMAARERSFAVGIASALPVSIEHIAKWAREAESRGLQLVPITAVAAKAKQS
jgi:polysaccharide deacetylase 2 family uncharacterized protein YibQ